MKLGESLTITLQRRPTDVDTTFGDLVLDGFKCFTLEDAIREKPGVKVADWKVHGETAIPEGRYEIVLHDSAKFGADTLMLAFVQGFSYIYIHSGNDDDDTEGCIIVGDRIDQENRKISGGKARGVLNKLKAIVVPAIKSGQRVFIDIKNPEGTMV